MQKKNSIVNNLATSLRYNLLRCESSEEWDKVVLNSINPSIVSLSSFLKVNHKNHENFLIRNRNEIIGGITFLYSDNNEDIVSSNRVIYTPIFYIRKIFKNRSIGTINVELYNIISAVYDHVISNFNSIDLTFDYHTVDIRPFVWHNFYNNKEKFSITPKFTSVINSENHVNKNFFDEYLLKNFIKTKRNEYRQAKMAKIELSNEIDLSNISRLMHDTFSNQGINIDKEYDLKNLLELLDDLRKKNLVKFYCTKDNEGSIFNFVIISIVNNTAQFLYSGRSLNNNSSYAGTYLHAEIIRELLNLNIQIIDLEGINSPKRAFFKIGFGGETKTYYNLKIHR